MKRLFISLALAAALVAALATAPTSDPAGATLAQTPCNVAVPPAGCLCSLYGGPSGAIIYAEYDALTPSYLQAACWRHYTDGTGGGDCTYRVRFYADRHTTLHNWLCFH